MPEKF